MPKRFRQKPSARKAAGPLAKQLILGYETARLVVHGQRQVHILPVRSSDHRLRYSEGQRLAVKGYMGGIVEAKVIVSAVHRIPLRSVDFRTARAFGAVNLDDFKRTWLRSHDQAWWVGFEEQWSQMENRHEACPDTFLARFESRWSDRDVWVVWFEIDRTETQRFLLNGAAGGGSFYAGQDRRWVYVERPEDREEDRGYTSSPARAPKEEPPALTDADYDRHIAKPSKSLAAEREKSRRMNAELLTDDERLEVAKRDAAYKGVDISRELGALNFTRNGRMVGAIEAIERKVYRVAA